MKPHESPRIGKKSIPGDSGDSWPVWNRGIKDQPLIEKNGTLKAINLKNSHSIIVSF